MDALEINEVGESFKNDPANIAAICESHVNRNGRDAMWAGASAMDQARFGGISAIAISHAHYYSSMVECVPWNDVTAGENGARMMNQMPAALERLRFAVRTLPAVLAHFSDLSLRASSAHPPNGGRKRKSSAI